MWDYVLTIKIKLIFIYKALFMHMQHKVIDIEKKTYFQFKNPKQK